MGKSPFILLVLIGFALTACSPKSPEGSVDLETKIKSGKELASKNGVEVYEGYIELLEQVNPNIKAQLKSPAGKKRLVDNLLEQEILYRESLKRGIQNLPKYREKAALYQRVIISQGLLEEEIEKQSTEYYEDNKEKEFSQVGLAHILIRVRKPNPAKKGDKGVTEQQALTKAKEAKKKLDEGVAWEEVVAEYSDDRLTKPRGGDLGKVGRQDRRALRLQWNDMIDKAFEMKLGDVSEPIKARDGYHIVKLTEASHVAPFDEVQNRIKFKLRGQVKREILTDLAGSKTEYKDEELIEITNMGSANRPIAKPQIPVKPTKPAPQATTKEEPKKTEAPQPEAKKEEPKAE